MKHRAPNIAIVSPAPTYLQSWKAIGRVLGRSERWCRYMASGDDPLPVFRVKRSIRVDPAELEAWLARQREKTIARDRIEPNEPPAPAPAMAELTAV